jgi:phosphatidylglycerol:prolipoprotein diacylglycerol transferase
MIPYFQYNSILLGPIPIQVWGLFVSFGLLSSILLAHHLTKKYLLSCEVILDLAIWAIIGGLMGARVFHVIFYEPVYYIQYPLDILKFWQGGASSLGGFIGAGLSVYIFSKIRKFSLKEILPYIDIATVSLWLGWGIGRLGCFMIHDHPGKLSNFFLAINFSSGARFDLGLLESFLAFALFTFHFSLFTKLIRIRWGLLALLSFMDYALIRFFLDFLRATDLPQSDARYFHLTPAQWGMGSVFLVLLGILIFGDAKRKKTGIKTRDES